MKTLNYFSLLFIVLSFPLLFINCSDDLNNDDWLTTNNNSNIPAVGNTTNAFAFAVAASNFNFNEEYSVDFNKNSISLGLTISNYRSGSGLLKFLNSKDSVYFSMSLNNNIVSGSKDVIGEIPKKISITLSNFSGQISIGVAGK